MSVENLQMRRLTQRLAEIPQEDYPVHSRVHRLSLDGIDCYVKREDELGCLCSGSKGRKYRTLIPALKNRRCQKVGLIGGQSSNQLLGLTPLLIENQIKPTLFLLKTDKQPVVGNALFLQLIAAKAEIHYLTRKEWPQVETIAADWHEQQAQYQPVIVPEGGSIDDCLAGLLTLAIDIIQNEETLGVKFKDLLIDSGSGLTAASLIAAFGFLKKECHIHVMLAAGLPEEFLQKLASTKKALETLMQETIEDLPRFTLHTPTTAKSFGATNTTLFDTIKEAASTHGFLLEPLYSCKLYLLLQEQQNKLAGPVLFIHSGGLFTLSGFQTQLSDSNGILLPNYKA